ncbi:hypothetical protein [Rufibacter sp. LB8]|uniref:hypothetical protein n=1 Tax=Rufibacter sp. LB8 TaxID=2777781 RepID=UPI00178C1EB4|nr:hypothetical protein [Rufibacter sp. LB8]
MKPAFPISNSLPIWVLSASVAVSAVAFYQLGYNTSRSAFGELLFWFGLAFLAFVFQIRAKPSLRTGLLLALGFRLIFLVVVPALSDDYFRFLWDGHLLINGHNPYLSLPTDWMQAGQTLPPGLSPALFSGLNSPNYYSVYPPVCQWVFGLSAWAGTSSMASLVTMRLCLVAAEVGTLLLLPKLLQKLSVPPRQALWYAFNPLVIVELTGNLHFEAFLIFFLVSALYLLSCGNWWASAIALGCAVASKLLPLLLLPLLVRVLGWPRALAYSVIVVATVMLFFLPFLSQDLLAHIGSSLTLYFQKFEFNASIYYLLRGLGFWLTGFNIISVLGLALSLVTLGFALWLGLKKQTKHEDVQWLVHAALALLTVYFLLATIVHPWYITSLVALAAGTRYRFAMVWSAMAVLSYAAYRSPSYQENLWLVTLEYTVVFGWLFWENRHRVFGLVSGNEPENGK